MLNSDRVLKEAIAKFGNNYTKLKDDEYLFPCPNCKKANTSNLHINPIKKVGHCFHCDYKVRLSTRATLNDVLSLSKENTKSNNKVVDDTIYLIPFHKKELTNEQLLALYKRGLSDDDIKYYHISGGDRIQIPNYVKGNFSDIICAWEWQKQKINKKTHPKYLYSEGVKKSNILFNLHNIPQNSEIILCEGIFNAITAGKNAVASYGCNLSNQQLRLLLNKQPKSITIAYDSDLPGVTGSLNVIKNLRSSSYKGSVYYILLPKGIDINDLGKEKFKQYLSKNRKTIDIYSELSCRLPKMLFDSME